MSARPFIDSPDFAGNGRQMNGEVPVAELPRLQDALADPQGILEYSIRGGVDKEGISFLEIGIAGNCRLRCQRCLGAVEHAVRIDTRLLLRNQADLDALGDDEEEEFDSILADRHLDVLELLEEEVLLSLPISPRHETGECLVPDGRSEHGKGSPFAVLAKLKRG